MKRSFIRYAAIGAVSWSAVLADAAFAHPGHGERISAERPAHYLFEPDHAAAVFAAVVFLDAATAAAIRRHRRRS